MNFIDLADGGWILDDDTFLPPNERGGEDAANAKAGGASMPKAA